jgi:23S rRNA pseudouridine2605 synthase
MNTEKPRKKLSLNREARGPAVEERLQKVLANAGLGSRRSLDERIAAGEIKVNGAVAAVGQIVKSGDRVELDGKAFVAAPTVAEEAEVLIYHKPAGEVTTHDDPEGRPTVFESLPSLKGARWISVGRLDINTTGLLLVTTDGELAHTLMHPSAELAREYICRVHGTVDEATMERLRQGVELDDGPAKFDELHVINLGDSHSWFRVVVHEGRNREVRRLWESQGLEVSRLKRTRYGNIELPRELRRGHHQALDAEQVKELRMSLGLPSASDTLTLEPVIGVRRAVKQNEFKPTSTSPSGWMHGAGDEARELRAFDRLRDDGRPARPAAGKRRRKGKGPKREGGKPGGVQGAAGATQRRARNAAAQRAWNSDNPAEFRSWLASREQGGPRGRSPQGQAQPGGRNRGPSGGPGGPGRMRFPSDHGSSPPGSQSGRRNRGPSDTRGGPRFPSDHASPQPGSQPGGRGRGPAGPGGPRFPSDHASPQPGPGNFTPRRGRNRRGPR